MTDNDQLLKISNCSELYLHILLSGKTNNVLIGLSARFVLLLPNPPIENSSYIKIIKNTYLDKKHTYRTLTYDCHLQKA